MVIRFVFLLTITTLLSGCWPFDSDESKPNPVTYEAEFTNPQNPIMQACDGEITLPKVLSVCKNNSGQVVDNSNCNNLPVPQVLFKSPSGEQVDPLVNDNIEIIGDKTFTCGEGKNRANSQVIVTCSDERYKLKGESNQRESFCKHFPEQIIPADGGTCIKFSDKKYECAGGSLAHDLNFKIGGLEPQVSYYFREVPYFRNSDSLTFGFNNLEPSSIKNGKLLRVEYSGPVSVDYDEDAIFVLKNEYDVFGYKLTCLITPLFDLKCRTTDPLKLGILSGSNYNVSGQFYTILNNVKKIWIGKGICIKKDDSKILCTGGSRPNLGLGPVVDLNNDNIEDPIEGFKEVPEFNQAVKISMGESICALFENETVKCAGGFFNTENPVEVEEFNGATDIISSSNNLCAIIDHRVYCYLFMRNYLDGYIYPLEEIEGFLGSTKIFSSGFKTICSIMNNSDVKCAGLNDQGQLGVGDTVQRLTPITVWEF